MANLEEVRMEIRGGEDEESSHPIGEGPPTSSGKNRRRSKKRRNSSDSCSSAQSYQSSSQGRNPEGKSENRSVEKGTQPTDSQKPDSLPTQEDYRTKFYEVYRREAEEYDREFIKRYDEDLNTTLIFAGLFSAVTSAFITQVQPQLQSDPNEETAALLRVLIHKIDNTTFGDDVPAVPQWTGPPHTVVQVQAILYASLGVSLFSAFLAMLGKQWLNRYASTDMRGSAIERSQNRQRKLDGIATWYFGRVLESLPLMLQFALLLLGCALCRYLWEIDTTVASVVLGVTSFGVASYIFFIVAGTASSSCPYQTPGANILRHIPPLTLSALHSASSHSRCIYALSIWWFLYIKDFRYSVIHVTLLVIHTFLSPITLSICLAGDAYYLTRVMIRAFITNTLRARGWFHRVCGRNPQTTTMDLHCISWMLQTSLDKSIHRLALKFLATMMTLAAFDSTLVSACFDILASCMSIVRGKVVILQGSEELAALSFLCFLRTFSHLTTVDPTSSAFKDVRLRYTRVFPIETDFKGLPSHHRFSIIHNIFYPSYKWVMYRGYYEVTTHRPKIQWRGYKPSSTERVALVQLARFQRQRTQPQKVPRWILRFAYHLLSQDSLPPALAVADCLSIIAMDLGCTVPSTTALDESERLGELSSLITKELENMARIADPDQIWSKRKVIIALFPYVVWQDRLGDGDYGMVDAFSGIIRAPEMVALLTEQITTLFEEASPDPPNRGVTLMSPHVDWGQVSNRNTVTWWAAAALAVPYTEEVGESVVDTLLQIASEDLLRPYIPTDIWAWLKKRPSLPPICNGRSMGTQGSVVSRVRELGDVEILESYLLIVWSEWDYVYEDGLVEMRSSIREEFGGIGMGRHREVLVKRLDRVLGQLDRGLGYLKQQNPLLDEDHIPTAREQYGELRKVLLEVDKEALEILTQSHSTFTCGLPLPCP